MSTEREKRNISPTLARYLLSKETRMSYLRGYRNIVVTEQDNEERYYVFEADSRDGRTKLKADVFLSEAAKPLFLRRRSTLFGLFGVSRNVDVTSYDDLETTFQVKELWRNRDKLHLFSVRSHLQKGRDGIHWLYETNGEIDKVEVHPNPSLKITFHGVSSQEAFITFLDDSDSPETNYSATANNNNGVASVEVKSEEGAIIIGGCVNKIDPLKYHLRLNQDGRVWKNIADYNPTWFSFSGTVKRGKS